MVLGYHEFAPTPSADIYRITPQAFSQHLEAIRRACVRLQESQEGIRHACADVSITFDDAHVSQVRYALPVLERTGTAGHFFVPTAWVGHSVHTATWSDLRALMRRGHRVGSHSHRHALLTRCSPAVLRDELVTSKKTLEDRLGEPIDSISMPGGRYNRRVLAECEDAGYRRIFTSRPQPDTTPVCPCNGSSVVVGRLIVRRTLPLSTIADYVRGKQPAVWRLQFGYDCRRAVKTLAGDSLYQTMWRRLLRRTCGTAPAEQGAEQGA